jgi:hypothetical protein
MNPISLHFDILLLLLLLCMQATIDSAAAALQQLEQLLPGSCSRLLCEAMLQLSVNEQPSLVKLRAAAASMFGGSAADGSDQQRSKQQQQPQQQKLPQISEVEQQSPPMQQQQQQQQRKMEQLGLGSSPAAGLLGKQRPFAGAGGAPGGVKSSSGGGAATAAGLPGVGQLGPLGSYLLARWREDATRSAAAAAQGHH